MKELHPVGAALFYAHTVNARIRMFAMWSSCMRDLCGSFLCAANIRMFVPASAAIKKAANGSLFHKKSLSNCTLIFPERQSHLEVMILHVGLRLRDRHLYLYGIRKDIGNVALFVSHDRLYADGIVRA